MQCNSAPDVIALQQAGGRVGGPAARWPWRNCNKIVALGPITRVFVAEEISAAVSSSCLSLGPFPGRHTTIYYSLPSGGTSMTFKSKKVALGVAQALGIGGAIAVVGAPAQAQDMRITVTGSSIKRVETEGALPVITLDRTYIEQSGYTTAMR